MNYCCSKYKDSAAEYLGLLGLVVFINVFNDKPNFSVRYFHTKKLSLLEAVIYFCFQMHGESRRKAAATFMVARLNKAKYNADVEPVAAILFASRLSADIILRTCIVD